MTRDRISVEEYRRLAAGLASTPKGRARSGPAIRIPKAQREKRDMSIAAVMLRLMAARTTGKLLLQPEERLAVDFANELRRLSVEGRLLAVWTHPANEIAGRRSGLAKIRYTIAKAMGLIDGAADYIFMGADRSAVLEAKVGRNDLADNQRDFGAWCEHVGVRHAVFRTVEEGLDRLSEWGLLAPAARPEGNDIAPGDI